MAKPRVSVVMVATLETGRRSFLLTYIYSVSSKGFNT